jgi:hypothetical protein
MNGIYITKCHTTFFKGRPHLCQEATGLYLSQVTDYFCGLPQCLQVTSGMRNQYKNLGGFCEECNEYLCSTKAGIFYQLSNYKLFKEGPAP